MAGGMLIGIVVGAVMSLIFPFINQSVFDFILLRGGPFPNDSYRGGSFLNTFMLAPLYMGILGGIAGFIFSKFKSK